MIWKEKVKLITDLGYDIDAAIISYAAKDNMRNNLKSIKKVIDDEARAKKAAVLGEVVEATKVLLAANPKMPEVAHRPSPSPPLVPSPTAVLYVSCNCRACCSSGHSRRGQGKRAKRRMGARAALQMGLRPPPTRISIG